MKPTYFLPEYISDLAPPQAQQLEMLRRDLIDCFIQYGYRFISPPIMEYADALSSGAGIDLQKNMMTFHESNERPMALRVDFTPQIARMDSIHADSDDIQRYCYAGTIMLRHPRTARGVRNPMQIGAELFGCADESADFETISLLLQSLTPLELDNCVLRISDNRIIKKVCQLANFNKKQQRQCLEWLQSRNINQYRLWLEQNVKNKLLIEIMASLPTMIGDLELAEKALWKKLAAIDEEVGAMLQRLLHFSQQVPLTNSLRLLIDIADMSGYTYHNGLTFSYYAGDTPIAQGGRYDGIGHYFGKSRSATGFSIDMDMLMLCLPEQKKQEYIWVEYSLAESAQAWVKESRQQGKMIVRALTANQKPPGYCTHGLTQSGDSWQIIKI